MGADISIYVETKSDGEWRLVHEIDDTAQYRNYSMFEEMNHMGSWINPVNSFVSDATKKQMIECDEYVAGVMTAGAALETFARYQVCAGFDGADILERYLNVKGDLDDFRIVYSFDQ